MQCDGGIMVGQYENIASNFLQHFYQNIHNPQ